MTLNMTQISRGLIAAALLSGFVAGCANPEAEMARIEATDNQNCLDLGFKPGTESYGNCRLKLREIRAKEGAPDPGVRFGIGVGVGSTF